jgi:hypothetical protein
MLAGFQKATLPTNIIHAFRITGIDTRWSEEHQALIAKIQRSDAMNVRH